MPDLCPYCHAKGSSYPDPVHVLTLRLRFDCGTKGIRGTHPGMRAVFWRKQRCVEATNNG
jgi:hypothetical protein